MHNPLVTRPSQAPRYDVSDYEKATGDEKIPVRFGEGSGLLKLVIGLVVVIGGLVLGFGLLFRSADKPTNEGGRSALQEHTAVMREAVQIAKEAQELNRQRMRDLQQLEAAQDEQVDASIYAEGRSD